MSTEPMASGRDASPGTALVPTTRRVSTGLGVTDLLARVSGLGLGAAGMAIRASADAVNRFVAPDGPAPAPPEIAGPMGRLVHTVPGLMLSAAYATRTTMLAFSAGLERGVTGALSTVGRPSVLARPADRMAESLEHINEWAFGEQRYNEMLVSEFVRRSAPAVAESMVTSIDLPEVTSQIPVNQIVAQIDLTTIIRSIDLNAVIAEVDIRPIADQVIDEIDIPAIIRATSASVTSDLNSANRIMFMHIDEVVARVADTVIRPRHRRQVQLEGYDPAAIEDRPGFDRVPGAKQRTDSRARIAPLIIIGSDYARERQGQRAGFASRAIATGIDLLAIIALAYMIGLVGAFFRFLFSADAFSVPTFTRGFTLSFGAGLGLLYYTASWTTIGRTVGDAIMGMRVVTEAGTRVRLMRSFVRAIAVVAVGTPCLFWCIVSKKNAALYDLPLKTTVVYDWTIN